jgi:hypothetical protein
VTTQLRIWSSSEVEHKPKKILVGLYAFQDSFPTAIPLWNFSDQGSRQLKAVRVVGSTEWDIPRIMCWIESSTLGIELIGLSLDIVPSTKTNMFFQTIKLLQLKHSNN